MNTVQLIYAGGTFGSHGTPLSPMPAEKFLPKLINYLEEKTAVKVNLINNTIIKDSSQLSINDFFSLYQLILTNYQMGHNHFILLTGTDTLSYLGAFLSEAFAYSDICISLTASMKPFFSPASNRLTVDTESDACANLFLAVKNCQLGKPGVRTCLQGETWFSQSVQKIHSHDLNAFSGNYTCSFPANTYVKNLPNKEEWVHNRIQRLPEMHRRATLCHVTPIYIFPNNIENLVQQVQQTIDFAESYYLSTNIVLFGFGTGNIPVNETLAQVFEQANKNKHIIVASTQCIYGGVNTDYASGSWQYQHGVLSAGKLSNEAIFARLVWLNLTTEDPCMIKAQWLAQNLDKITP